MGQNFTNFDDFLGLLRKTNANLSYFTDFEKCDENLQIVSIKLHTLNFLLGKNDLKTNINRLFKYDKECFDVLNLLIAVRDKNTDVIDNNRVLTKIKTYFNDPEKIYEFFVKQDLIKFL